MTQPYTDTEIVARAIKARTTPGYWDAHHHADLLAEVATSALAAAGRLIPADTDEHGNRADNCGVCTLVPSVNGWTRMTQSGCPVHGPYTWASPVTVTGFDTEEDTDG